MGFSAMEAGGLIVGEEFTGKSLYHTAVQLVQLHQKFEKEQAIKICI